MKRGVSVTKGLADLAEGLAELKISTHDGEDDFDLLKAIQTCTDANKAEDLFGLAYTINDPSCWLAFLENPTLSAFITIIELQKILIGMNTYIKSSIYRPPALHEIGHTIARNAQWCQWLSYPAFLPYLKEDKKLREYIVGSADFLMRLDHKLISDLVVDFPDNALTVLQTLYKILNSKLPTSKEFKLTILTLQWIKERSPSIWAQSENLDGYIAKHGEMGVKVFVLPKDHVTVYTPLRTALQNTQDATEGVTIERSELSEKEKKVLNISYTSS